MIGTNSGFARLFPEKDRLIVPASDELRALVAGMRSRPRPPLKTLDTIEPARRNFEKLVESGLRAMDLEPHRWPDEVLVREIKADGVPLVVAEPRGAVRGALLHIHGGGWHLGRARAFTPALADWSIKTSAIVASVDYRLAPEHRHPAALEDCERAAQWWIEHVRAEHGCEHVVVMGESAGAYLALLTALRLRSRDIHLAGVVLTYGLYDFTNTLPSRTVADDGALMIDSRSCALCTQIYLANPADAFCEDISPLRAEITRFANLPPALFVAGTLDPLVDDSILMHERWQRAGNRAWLALYQDAPHAFDLFMLPETRHLNALRLAFVRNCFTTDIGS